MVKKYRPIFTPIKTDVMQEQESGLFLIKALCAQENRKRVKRLLLGAILLNIGGFAFMYGIIYTMLFIDKMF